MPEVAEFAGVKIFFYYFPKEHPPPHFHAIYGDEQASFDLQTLEIMAGSLRRAKQRKVLEWARTREAELDECWRRAAAGLPMDRID